jgi:hypothetical protein
VKALHLVGRWAGSTVGKKADLMALTTAGQLVVQKGETRAGQSDDSTADSTVGTSDGLTAVK